MSVNSRLVRLQTRPRAEQQLVAMVYNYPPGGSHFGASFLNVPRSLEVVSTRLQEAGYAIQPLPEAEWITRLQPLLAAYYPQADLRALLEQDQAAALPLADYLAWWRQQPIDRLVPVKCLTCCSSAVCLPMIATSSQRPSSARE